MYVKSQLDFIKIGLRVREIRKAARLKPGEFGDIICVGDRHVSNIESAARHLSPELASNICDAYPQYMMDYIFRGIEVDQIDNLYVRINKLDPSQREIIENLISTLEQQSKK